MWQRNTWFIGLCLNTACLDIGSVPTGQAPKEAIPSSQIRSEHLWVFHVAGGPYAEHIQLVAIGDQADVTGPLVFRPLSSRAWDGSIVNDFEDVQAMAVNALGRSGDGSIVDDFGNLQTTDTLGWSWTLYGTQSGQTLELTYTLNADTAIGALRLADGTNYPVFGVRFDSSAIGLVAPRLPPTSRDTLPVVLIRLDDASASDRDFLQRLAIRGLTAEIAVPTRFLGSPNKLTWQDLEDWRARGMGVVLHSRNHLRTNADAQHFVGETVGGFAEMAARGFESHIFVQPGTWTDSIYFDSPAKLSTWRGALLQTFTTVSECYAYGSLTSTRGDNLRLGISHATISDGVSDAWIRAAWQVALRPNHATVFLVHTYRLATPDRLDWFLDMVASAKARGAVAVVANSEELFEPPESNSGNKGP